MATYVCDLEECDCFKLIRRMLWALPESKYYELVVQRPDGKHGRIHFVYCPFCGTRLDDKWIEADKTIPRNRVTPVLSQ